MPEYSGVPLDSSEKKKAAKLIQEAMSLLSKDGVGSPSEWISDYVTGDMGGMDDREEKSDMDEESGMPKKMLVIAALKKRSSEE